MNVLPHRFTSSYAPEFTSVSTADLHWRVSSGTESSVLIECPHPTSSLEWCHQMITMVWGKLDNWVIMSWTVCRWTAAILNKHQRNCALLAFDDWKCHASPLKCKIIIAKFLFYLCLNSISCISQEKMDKSRIVLLLHVMMYEHYTNWDIFIQYI